MAKEKKNVPQQEAPVPETETAETETVESSTPEISELDQAKADLKQEHENYLRLAAEYDNFRKRSQKEKEASYTDAKSDAVSAFLPLYDNLERALQQETADEAYKKGVELIMQGFLDVLTKLNVTVYGEAGETFDPAKHNAVMHIEDETMEENVIAEVFQKGFAIKEKTVRFAMVKVAN